MNRNPSLFFSRRSKDSNLKLEKMQSVDEPPDGGWGWMVVLSTFLVHVMAIGAYTSMGVFYAEFRDVFNESAGTTSFISSVFSATLLMGSPIASALSNLTSCRAVVMAGGVISAVGLGVSFFAQNIVHLIITIGLITGFGMSLMYSPSLAMIGKYFHKRHATANGIAVSGTGVSMFILSPLFQLLIDEFRWNGALLIFGGMTLNGCVFGALLRPLHLKDARKAREVENADEETADSSKPCKAILPFCQKVLEMFDVPLLKSRPFLVYSLSLFLLMLGNSMIYVHLVANAQALGVEKTQAAFLPSILGIAEAVARPINGWLSDRLPIRKLYYYMAGSIGLGICNIAIPYSRTYAALVACMVFYGISSGTFYPLIVVLVRKYSGVSRISGGLGWAFVFQGAAFLLGQPIAGTNRRSYGLITDPTACWETRDTIWVAEGANVYYVQSILSWCYRINQWEHNLNSWLHDATGNYDMSFYAAATFIFVSVVILLLLVPRKGRSWALESGEPAPDVPRDECDGVVGLQARQLPADSLYVEAK
ncbi:SLC16A12 [Branchiostoma lanceolatum]|uniref:SLC16A12 protein n=1 Tax=Branchiostoma lanceolatum TaxID=7740 RepID=A0A8J9Z0I3_BRALA|nr:SLC16A12 [Branchiostoma lanceolatum]